MAYWSAAFLMIALAAGIMGAGGFAGVSALAASGLFLAGLVLALFPLVLERREPAREPAPSRSSETR
jgi:uncharacterized membrane protein YtjA (UPF0391 family)